MTPEDLRQANNEQMLFFFKGYEFTWRLTKILSFKMLLENRDELAKYLRASYGEQFSIDENYIDGSVTNGLVYSALVELAMHIEDLLALIKFVRREDDFAKKITWYRASELTGSSGSFFESIKLEIENSTEKILSRFLIPNRTYVEACIHQSSSSDSELPNLEFYDFGTTNLISYMSTAVHAYENIKSFYQQYKHGLKIRLRDIKSSPSRRDYHKEIIAGDILSLHNDPWDEGLRNGRIAPGVIFPGHGPISTQNSEELASKKNLFQYDQLPSLPIDHLVDVAKKVMNLIYCIINNRAEYISSRKPGYRMVLLPFPRENYVVYDLYLDAVNGKLICLNDFELTLKQ